MKHEIRKDTRFTDLEFKKGDVIIFEDSEKVVVREVKKLYAIIQFGNSVWDVWRSDPKVFDQEGLQHFLVEAQGFLRHGDVLMYKDKAAIVDIDHLEARIKFFPMPQSKITFSKHICSRVKDAIGYFKFIEIDGIVLIHPGDNDVIYDGLVHPKLKPLIQDLSAVYDTSTDVLQVTIDNVTFETIKYLNLHEELHLLKDTFNRFPDPRRMVISDDDGDGWAWDILQFNEQLAQKHIPTASVRTSFKMDGVLTVKRKKAVFHYRLPPKMFAPMLPSDKWKAVARTDVIEFKGPEYEVKTLAKRLKQLSIGIKPVSRVGT